MKDYFRVLKKYGLFFLFNLVLFTVLKIVLSDYIASLNEAFLVIIGIFIGLILSEFKGEKERPNKNVEDYS